MRTDEAIQIAIERWIQTVRPPQASLGAVRAKLRRLSPAQIDANAAYLKQFIKNN